VMSCLEWMYIKMSFKRVHGYGCPGWYRLSVIRLPSPGIQKKALYVCLCHRFLTGVPRAFATGPARLRRGKGIW
jgi:hypothetical protein